ncbi:ribonuclease H-like protein [Paxillus ammoniavirescens]|nr:ribonuclease H-like protein [Paxillus ammoniavirescens]
MRLFSLLLAFISSDRKSVTASSNWLALQKVLPQGNRKRFPPRKRRKIDDEASTPPSMSIAFPRGTSSAPSFQPKHNAENEQVDLDTAETKNGESIAGLRKMILGKVDYLSSQATPGKYLALDCEMVGVGIEGTESSLARVSIVNYAGAIVLDVFVRQRERVIDYRTQWSGVRMRDLGGGAKLFEEVQKTVADLIKNRILVGHAVYNDLKALLLSHPSSQTRDTQSLAYKHRLVKSRRPALRVLVHQELGVAIQGGEHSSVTDARATMALFRLHKKQWESRFQPLHSVVQSKSGGDSRLELGPGSSPAPEQPRPTPSNPSKRKRGSDPATDPVPRKGVSSGLSTIVRRVGGGKEVKGKGLGGNISRKGSFAASGSKKTGTGSGGEKWWTSLGGSGGKKGSIRV